MGKEQQPSAEAERIATDNPHPLQFSNFSIYDIIDLGYLEDNGPILN